ncbi:hypothetical protein AACH06_00505 [Ideonella sp. DXS29W]|uniref:Energy transducer TonB n=1 Tax=Ideonella lacteola TaxID=2984193 RepID=A0ABU9BHQ5_9BURK
MTTRPDSPWATRRHGAGLGLAVLALHLGLIVALWHAMHRRVVEVPHEPLALMLWPLREPTPPPTPDHPRPQPNVPTRQAEAAHRSDTPSPATPSPSPRPAVRPHQSTWITPAPTAQAAPSSLPTPEVSAQAPAASAPPAERLLDSAATRDAIRQAARRPLLQERAAEATGQPIERTDTALARAVQEAAEPDCLKDPKAASGQIGPVALGGLLGLPFLAARAVTGRCAR